MSLYTSLVAACFLLVFVIQGGLPVLAQGDDEGFLNLLTATCGSTNCYKILGLKSDASAIDIRRKYRDLGQIFHPDKFDKTSMTSKQAKEKFQQIARAYEILSDRDKRKTYDLIISDPGIWTRLKMMEKGISRVKTNWFFVVPIILATLFLFEWFVRTSHYQQALDQYKTRRRMKKKVSSTDSMSPPSSPRQKKMERRKGKPGKSSSNTEAAMDEEKDDELIILAADGSRILPYSLKTSIVFQAIAGRF